MLHFYFGKVVLQLTWFLIAWTALREVRRSRNWPEVLQLVGSALLALWIVADWVLAGPIFGILLTRLVTSSSVWLDYWTPIQQVLIAAGMLTFSIGYFGAGRSRWRAGQMPPPSQPDNVPA